MSSNLTRSTTLTDRSTSDRILKRYLLKVLRFSRDTEHFGSVLEQGYRNSSNLFVERHASSNLAGPTKHCLTELGWLTVYFSVLKFFVEHLIKRDVVRRCEVDLKKLKEEFDLALTNETLDNPVKTG